MADTKKTTEKPQDSNEYKAKKGLEVIADNRHAQEELAKNTQKKPIAKQTETPTTAAKKTEEKKPKEPEKKPTPKEKGYTVEIFGTTEISETDRKGKTHMKGYGPTIRSHDGSLSATAWAVEFDDQINGKNPEKTQRGVGVVFSKSF
jgi:hypothetical protein